MRVHNNTIRKYVQALLDQLNDFQVQYITSDGKIINRPIPIVYGKREKSNMYDFVEQSFIERGNYNVLPRSYLNLAQMMKAEDIITNKLLKKNVSINGNFQEFIFNPVPYEFTFEFTIFCRGMNEAAQVAEAVQTKFNPVMNIDIWEQKNLSEPTRIPVKLLDIQISDEGYSEESINIIQLDCSLQIIGALYQPNNVDVLINEEMEPCEPNCTGCDNCTGITYDHSKVLPIIKEVGFGLRVSSDPQNKVTDEIQRLEMFDVDENGYIICSLEQFDYKNKLEEVNLYISELYDIIPTITDQIFEQELVKVLIRFKKDIFEMKSNINSETETNIIQTIHKLDRIIWGYDDDRTKFNEIKEVLKNPSSCLE